MNNNYKILNNQYKNRYPFIIELLNNHNKDINNWHISLPSIIKKISLKNNIINLLSILLITKYTTNRNMTIFSK